MTGRTPARRWRISQRKRLWQTGSLRLSNWQGPPESGVVDKDVSAPEYNDVEPRTLQYIAEACHGELAGTAANTVATGISTDSRKVHPGDVFFAIKGDKFDGHDFLPDVVRAGSAAVVAKTDSSGCANIHVSDPRIALGQFAARY